MLSQELLGRLCCPYCGSDLEPERRHGEPEEAIRDGVVRCACSRFPVVAGILVLRQSEPQHGGDVDRALDRLSAGDPAAALRQLLIIQRPSRLGGALSFGGRLGVPWARSLAEREKERRIAKAFGGVESDFCSSVRRLRFPLFAQYLVHRFANPSFMAAIPLLLLLDELDATRRGHEDHVLDLACGTGHASFLMELLFPHLNVISVDCDFTNLYLARKYLLRRGTSICIDAEHPLPFASSFFRSVFCLDALHYIFSKRALLAELDRVLRPEGLWLFPHLHNALRENPAAGTPLSPDDYRRIFELTAGKLFPETQFLDDYCRELVVELDRESTPEELRGAPGLSFVGCRREGFWRPRKDLDQVLLRGRSHFEINPIYGVRRVEGELQLEMRWPSATLREECRLAERYLPRTRSLDPSLVSRCRGPTLAADDPWALRTLLKEFVLVPLPADYGVLPSRASSPDG